MTRFARRLANPTAPANDPAAVGLAKLCDDLAIECDVAELRRDGDEAEFNLRAFVARAKNAGLNIKVGRASKRRLGKTDTPFLMLGDGDRAWVVRDRRGTRLMLVDPIDGISETATLGTAASFAQTVISVAGGQRSSETGVSEARSEQVADQTDRLSDPPPRPHLDRHAQNHGEGLWQRATSHRLRPALIEIAVASIMINLLALATPLFMMTVYNKVISHAALATLDVLAIGMLTLVAFELVLRATRGYVVAHAGAKLDMALSQSVLHRLLSMPHSQFERTPSGQLTERLRQLDQLRSFLTGNLPLLLVDLAFVTLFLAAIFFLSPSLGWITLLAMPVFVAISALAHKRQRKLVAANFAAGAGKSSNLAEAVAQALTVKSLGLEGEMERRFENRQLESAWTGFKAARLGHLVGSSGQALQHLTGLLVIYVGAKMIIAGTLSIGALIACTILSARALSPMRQLFFAWFQLQQARDAIQRLDQLFGEVPPARPGKLILDQPIRGHYRCDNVSFRYAPEKPLALDSIDLEIEPGTMLALIGPPGSGKSTLAKLMVALDRPSAGRVLLDDHDISHLSPKVYLPQIGMVPQEVQLFAGTLAENIAMAAEDKSLGRVIAAAKFVGLHDIVQRLPEGYETRLGERGTGLSLGQRQLVSIARALVRNPRILILDEATSALDDATERNLLNNLARAGSGRTIILITHRRSVVERCNRAAYLQGGVLELIGEPQEVLQMAEIRARQVNLQAVN